MLGVCLGGRSGDGMTRVFGRMKRCDGERGKREGK